MTRRNVRKQGWVFPLFSPDSDDWLSLNFHRFVILYISCDTRSVGLGQYCLPKVSMALTANIGTGSLVGTLMLQVPISLKTTDMKQWRKSLQLRHSHYVGRLQHTLRYPNNLESDVLIVTSYSLLLGAWMTVRKDSRILLRELKTSASSGWYHVGSQLNQPVLKTLTASGSNQRLKDSNIHSHLKSTQH